MSESVTRDEFEDVKLLLASAARYAESANERLDRVALQQSHNTLAITMLSERMDRFTERVNYLADTVAELSVTVESLAQQAAQDRSQAAIDRAEFRTTVEQLLQVLTQRFNGNGNA